MVALKKKIELPSWLILGIIIVVIILLSGGGYGYSEYRDLKKAHKDSLKAGNKKVRQLENDIENADTFEENEQVITRTYWKEYLRERKLRKDAENNLFIFRNYNRKYIDSYLSGYKFRRVE